jgi:DNA-binding transcriptional LysR family regulator
MEIRDLRAFVTVVELQGFTRAASRLHVVQPTISQAVGRLEHELGLQLIERRPDGVRPTPAGADFLRHAQGILNSVERAESDMAAHRGLSKGRVNLGIVPTVTPLLMAPLLRRLNTDHPGLEVHLEEGLADDLIERVRVGHVDLAVSLLPADAAGLAVQPLTRQPLCILIGSGHRLARTSRVDVADLREESWISFPTGNPGRRWLEKACRTAGFEPRITAVADAPAQMKPYIEAGRAVAMMPRWVFQAEIAQGTLQTLEPIGAQLMCVVASIIDNRHTSRAMTLVHEEIRTIVGAAS